MWLRRSALLAILVAVALGGILLLYKNSAHRVVPLVLSESMGDPNAPGAGSLLDLHLGRADYVVQACCDTSLTVAPIDDATQSAWFSIQRGEPLIKGSNRAELRFAAQHYGVPTTFSADVFVPKEWPQTSYPVLVMQWHGSRDRHLRERGRFPPLEIVIEDGHWVVKQASDTALISQTGAHAPQQVELARAPMIPGQIARWQIDVTWDWRSNGHLFVALNGQKLVEQAGPNAFRDLVGPYWKLGVYSPKWKKQPPDQEPSTLSVAFVSASVEVRDQE